MSTRSVSQTNCSGSILLETSLVVDFQINVFSIAQEIDNLSLERAIHAFLLTFTVCTADTLHARFQCSPARGSVFILALPTEFG